MDLETAPLDDVFRAWEVWKQRAAHAVNVERTIRAELVKRLHPAPKEGSNHAHFDVGPPPQDGLQVDRVPAGKYDLLLKHSIDRKVDEGLLDALKAQATSGAVDNNGQPHPLAGVNFDTVIRRKPELATTAYKALPELQRTWFDTCLVIKPGSPQIEIKPFKAK